MLGQFQLYSKMIQLYIYMNLFFFKFFFHVLCNTCPDKQVLVSYQFSIWQCVQVNPKLPGKFEVNEEFAFEQLAFTITGESIFKDIEKTLIQYNPKQNLLRPVMVMCGAWVLAERFEFTMQQHYSCASHFFNVNFFWKEYFLKFCLRGCRTFPG